MRGRRFGRHSRPRHSDDSHSPTRPNRPPRPFPGDPGLGDVAAYRPRIRTFLGQRFASDLNQFGNWASVLAQGGPGSFYQSSGANYPPGYMYVLWLLGALGWPVGSVLGISSDQARQQLLMLAALIALADGWGEPAMALAVALGQTLAFIALLGVWVAFAFGPLLRRSRTWRRFARVVVGGAGLEPATSSV